MDASSSIGELFLRPAYRACEAVISFDQARQLAEVYGTPLLAISRQRLVENYQSLRAGLPSVEFFYAAKANPSPIILETLSSAGCSVDVASYGELRAALGAGFTTTSVLHTHPCKTIANLTSCYQAGVRWFVFDTESEIPKLSRYAPDANLLLRLAAHSTSSVIQLSAKFGSTCWDAVPLMMEARAQGLEVKGLSFHVGSQCLSPDDFAAALMLARSVWDEAAAAGIELEVLDLGGGIPAPYRTEVMSLEDYCHIVQRALTESFGDVPVRVIAEPGRCLCADAVTLVTQVIGSSVRNGQPHYIIDDGLYGSFSGKVFDHADFVLLAESAENRFCRPCVVAGPTCDSTDLVSQDQELPELSVGELLMVPTMGAYTSASASTFNGLDLATEVAVA